MKIQILKKIIASMIAIFSLGLCNAQTVLEWQHSYTGNGYDEYGNDVHLGGDGNIYTCGYTASGTGTIPLDALIISYQATGGTQNWVTTYANAGNGDDMAYAMTTYGSGSTISIYVTGDSYVGTTNIDDALWNCKKKVDKYLIASGRMV